MPGYLVAVKDPSSNMPLYLVTSESVDITIIMSMSPSHQGNHVDGNFTMNVIGADIKGVYIRQSHGRSL